MGWYDVNALFWLFLGNILICTNIRYHSGNTFGSILKSSSTFANNTCGSKSVECICWRYIYQYWILTNCKMLQMMRKMQKWQIREIVQSSISQKPPHSSPSHMSLVCLLYFGANMMTSSNGNIFRVTGPLCGEFTGHRWRRALIFSLICAWTNGWVNNREAGDLRRNRAHYDVTVSFTCNVTRLSPNGIKLPIISPNRTDPEVRGPQPLPAVTSLGWSGSGTGTGALDRFV